MSGGLPAILDVKNEAAFRQQHGFGRLAVFQSKRHVADLMANKGVVWASDRNTRRLDTLKRRAPLTLRFRHPDATALRRSNLSGHFGGARFMFTGLMQIPVRVLRQSALRELRRVCAPGAPLLATTHDRDSSPTERTLWRLEALRWTRGDQDPRLVEFGERYFEDEAGCSFLHLPDRGEILEDLAATGWAHAFDAMRAEVARETRAVREFSGAACKVAVCALLSPLIRYLHRRHLVSGKHCVVSRVSIQANCQSLQAVKLNAGNRFHSLTRSSPSQNPISVPA